jgi:hypothetical protein
MSNLSFIVANDGSITAVANNKSYVVGRDHPNYDGIKAAIKANDVAALVRLADIPKSVNNFTSGRVEVRDGTVFYGNDPLHNAVTDRILSLMREGFPFEPVCRFLENLMQNPSARSVKELYTFLAHQHLPITEDGHFLAYKRVRDNWFDIYSGKFDNSIGKVVEITRSQVDDDFRNGCSFGLHVGAIEYVRGYSGGGCESGGHVVIVKVNPKDAVSVPTDENCTKLRVCRYEVIGEYTGDLTSALYTSSGVPSTPSAYNPDEDDDDDYDDDDDDWNDDDDLDDDEDDDDDDDLDDDEEDCGYCTAPSVTVDQSQPSDQSQPTEQPSETTNLS